MKRRRSAVVVTRDQEPSVFSSILERLCRVTAARGGALVDVEGETVDYGGTVEPFAIKVAAAEWRLILQYLGESRVPGWVATHELVVRARERSYLLYALSDGYALVLELPRYCFSVSRRAVVEAVEALSHEAGFDVPAWCKGLDRFRAVRVRTDEQSRPGALWEGEGWRELSIIGRYVEATFRTGEMGYRVRLADGNELTLVRERLGHWYVDTER